MDLRCLSYLERPPPLSAPTYPPPGTPRSPPEPSFGSRSGPVSPIPLLETSEVLDQSPRLQQAGPLTGQPCQPSLSHFPWLPPLLCTMQATPDQPSHWALVIPFCLKCPFLCLLDSCSVIKTHLGFQAVSPSPTEMLPLFQTHTLQPHLGAPNFHLPPQSFWPTTILTVSTQIDC